MIELNKKTQQDFLNREWVQKLLDAGVDIGDAKYHIVRDHWCREGLGYGITLNWKNHAYMYEEHLEDVCPTYTVSELLYKLHEWINPTLEDGHKYCGGLRMIKDAPLYIFYYDLQRNSNGREPDRLGEKTVFNSHYIYAEFEYPIESLASLLIQCHKKDIGIDKKDTGNISSK
jgi:hypothetical protein